MKKLFVAVLLLGAVCSLPQVARAQAAAYGEFSVVKMQNLAQDNVLAGVTAGVSVDGPTLFRVTLGGDVEAGFAHKSNFNFDTVTVGGRVSIHAPFGTRPYAGLNVGFGRIKNLAEYSQATTDGLLAVKLGVRKKLTGHLDAQGEFGYNQFYAYGGEYNPKAFNVGVVYYFAKR